MAYAPLPKLAYKPGSTSKMCPTDGAKTTLTDVLQSEHVKRLFNLPNLVVKTIPLKINATSDADRNDERNGFNKESSKSKESQVSFIPIEACKEENKDDENFLPSKKEGKSEITLLPINHKEKPCGHYEPCEDVVCDVAIRQYIDRDGALPMLATSIDEDDINAPVTKHCKNKKCDALSIDHNRCRRALIKLNRCDRSKVCDICGAAFETQKSRINHASCTRKNIYRHNNNDGVQVLKERMRVREIQLIEASKSKRNDYMDPVMGYNLAMETLRKNKELIIIPKSIPVQQPTITIMTVPTGQTTQYINNVQNVIGSLLPNIPIVLPQQSIVFGKTPCSNENNSPALTQVSLSDNLSTPFTTASNSVPLPQNQFINLASQNNTQSITINDLIMSQSQIVTSTPLQSNPLITPIRVVPITNLITQPSLLHQTQGIPKFCIMADNTIPSITISNPPTVQPTVNPKIIIPNNSKEHAQKKKNVPMNKKRKIKKKDFKCSFCFKRFTTDWYFKIHVAKHTGEKKFSCKLCTRSFSNRYDVKRHIANDHNNLNSEQTYKCIDCGIIYTSASSIKHHRLKCHGKTVCKFCDHEFLEEELKDHIALAHGENAKETERKCKRDNSSEDLSETQVPDSIIKYEHDVDMGDDKLGSNISSLCSF